MLRPVAPAGEDAGNHCGRQCQRPKMRGARMARDFVDLDQGAARAHANPEHFGKHGDAHLHPHPREEPDQHRAGEEIGIVTSGSPSPTLCKNIALAYVPPEFAAVGTLLCVEVRSQRIKAQVVPTPFYKRPKKIAPQVVGTS